MFVISELSSLVRLEPDTFDKDLPEALSDALTKKLANKVVKDVGLVISLFDIQSIGESHLMAGDGATHTKVKFRVLVFRPFLEEVLTGKIKSSTKEGVTVSLGFFDDIMIPSEALQHPCRFDESDQVWVWEYPTEDGDHHDLYMDAGEEIRFRVTTETFVDTSPSGPKDAKSTPGVAGAAAVAADLQDDEETRKIPYHLTASINEPGLGLLSWWNS